jgi:hypothetical protein
MAGLPIWLGRACRQHLSAQKAQGDNHAGQALSDKDRLAPLLYEPDIEILKYRGEMDFGDLQGCRDVFQQLKGIQKP